MIEVSDLTKRYRRTLAVDRVSFACEPGTVTGFLGPNGAGKSTTLRMLTGLTSPTSGTATVAGTVYRDLPNPGRIVGVVLDAAAQHVGRTGRETLRLAATLLGVPLRRADDLLEQVGLDTAAGDRVGTYSLGMRQRLGIAQALLGNPAVLVLDEPGNGLDPEGIRWLRSLLRAFAGDGGTVLLSSHLLREVEATVDRLVVADRGRIVAQGDLTALLGNAGVLVRSLDEVGLAAALQTAGLRAAPHPSGGLRVDASPEAVGRAACAAGQTLVELRELGHARLEDWFLSVTADESEAGGVTAPCTDATARTSGRTQ